MAITVLDMKRKSDNKRYHLVLPNEMYSQVELIADKHAVNVSDVFRRFIKLGLKAIELEEEPESALIIREDGKERELMFFM